MSIPRPYTAGAARGSSRVAKRRFLIRAAPVVKSVRSGLTALANAQSGYNVAVAAMTQADFDGLAKAEHKDAVEKLQEAIDKATTKLTAARILMEIQPTSNVPMENFDGAEVFTMKVPEAVL
jgi:predicted lipid-binding transport protein (Tim44 family)